MADVNISKYRASVVRDGSKPASPGFVVSEGQDPVNPPGTNNFVPYTGATANVELGEYGLESGFVTLDTTPTNTPTDQGTIYWDATRSTAALIMNGTLQHIGQDTFFYVKNSSGSSIPKGTCVRFAGTDGASGHLLVTPFLANGSVPSSYFMGVTSETIANGSFGQVMHFGELTGINTSAFTAGALLYASTTVAGGFQTTAPVAPNNIVLVAAAINSKNNGAIIVRPQIGSNINNDEGVKITSPTTGDLLQLQAGGLWENKTLAQVIGSAYVPSTRTLTINGTAFDLSANRSWTVGDVRTDGSYSNPSWITALAWSKISGTPTTLSGYGITDAYTETEVDSLLTGYVTLNTFQNISGSKIFGTNRLIMDGEGTAQPTSLSNTQTSNSALASHNSFGFNGSNNIYFNKGTTANGGIFAFSNSATRTYTLKDASGTLAFTSDIPSLSGYVQGSGTTNYVSKFTGSGTIGNSQIFDNGTNVGIGTASPNAKLDIGSGDIYVRTGLIAVNTLDSYNQTLTIRSNGNTAIFIPNTQNVLIGTTSDNGARLQVSGTATFSSNVTAASIASNNGGFRLKESSQTSSRNWIIGNDWLVYGDLGIGQSTTQTGATYTYPIYINPSGNVGIGTTTDNGARLQTVGGPVSFTSVNDGTAIFARRTGGENVFALNVNLDSSWTMYDYASGSYLTGISQKRGNVGIGVTPSSWDTGNTVKAVEISQGAFWGYGTTNVYLASNYYWSGSNRIYLKTAPAAEYSITNGAHEWYSASSGTAGNAVTLNPRMVITSGGNVLIGTTTDAGFKLRVQNGQTYFVGAGSSSSTYSLIIQDSGTNNQFLVRDDGLISFPKTASLWTTGNAANAWINPSGGDLYRSTSSIKYKKNVQNYDKGLKEVLNLRPVTYQGIGKIDSNKTFAGLIAEEVHELGLSEFVQYAEDGSPDALGYQNMVALLTKAIQELKQEIDTLKN